MPRPASRPEPVLWASSSFALTGAHSGLTPLVPAINGCAPGLVRLVGREETTPRLLHLARRVARKIDRLVRGAPPFAEVQKSAPFYSEMGWALERRIRMLMRQSTPQALVFESLDDQFFTLARDRREWPGTRFVGICHQPPSWWGTNSSGAEHFRALDRMVVLSTEALAYWQAWLGPEKVVFIPHGADIDFFVPAESRPPCAAPLRVIFCGNWLRDFDTVGAVVRLADEKNLAVHFDLVIPSAARDRPALSAIKDCPHVSWHAGLSDEGLRGLYQQSDLMLQTLRDSTANNAILEGMACGLPLIVTDIGGTRDYASETFATFVPPSDPQAVVAAIESSIANRQDLSRLGHLARAHLVQNLGWRTIAERHVQLLQALIESGSAAR